MEISPSPSFTARIYNRFLALLADVRRINYSNYLYHRAKLEQLARLLPRTGGVRYEPGTLGDMRTEWMTPSHAREDAVLYYLHGGGYVVCSINTHRALIARIAKAARIKAFAIDYRLAPENPFPAAIMDAMHGYEHLLEKGFSPDKIVIAGDSAGGGLVLATMLMLRDKKIPLPAAAICIAPWTDLEGIGGSHTTNARTERLLTHAAVQEFGKIYAGKEDIRNPLISPLYADLTGLPPLLLQVSTSEILLDDSVRLHEHAVGCGVKSTLQKWAGMLHVWHVYPFIPESRKAIRYIAEFVDSILGGGNPKS